MEFTIYVQSQATFTPTFLGQNQPDLLTSSTTYGILPVLPSSYLIFMYFPSILGLFFNTCDAISYLPPSFLPTFHMSLQFIHTCHIPYHFIHIFHTLYHFTVFTPSTYHITLSTQSTYRITLSTPSTYYITLSVPSTHYIT